jgi:hypothetical protein
MLRSQERQAMQVLIIVSAANVDVASVAALGNWPKQFDRAWLLKT